jgi:hypothetical protein
VAWCGEGKEGAMGQREERAQGEGVRVSFLFLKTFSFVLF